MKIKIVSDMITPYMGGSEVYVQNLSRELIKLGFDVEWIGMRLSPYLKKEEVNEDGIKIRRIDMPFNERRLFCLNTQLFPALKDADVLQFNSFVSAMTGGYIAKILKKPSIGLVHEFFRKELWKKFTSNKIEQIVYPMMENLIAKNPYTAWIVPCDYTRRTLMNMGIDGDKIKKIPHGIDHKKFHPVYGSYREKYHLWDRFVIGHVGRLGFTGTCYSKNLKTLFVAFKKVKDKIPNAVLLIAGTGFENVEWYIKEMGLDIGKDVIYVGKIPNDELVSFYNSMDVFATASLSEGFSFVTVESEACGTPVVCFRGAGALDETAKVGKLVSPQTPSALAKGIIEMHKFPNMKNQMSRNAIEWTKQYDWKKTAKEYKKIYEDLYVWDCLQ